MGIRGLTYYINQHADYFLEPYELHDTWLVIDGDNICTEIAKSLSLSPMREFGNSYCVFSHVITSFFRTLQICKILPVIIMDGVKENIEENIATRPRRDIITVCNHRKSYYSTFLNTIFISIAQRMGIKLVRCIYQADNTIAAIAKKLKCPVLSADSDFYFYGVNLVPYLSLVPAIQVVGDKHSIPCKLYRIEKLYQKFNGLRESHLALALGIMAEKYFNAKKHFFRKIRQKFGNHVETTLQWLINCPSNSTAIRILLGCIEKSERSRILNFIEDTVNQYCIPSVCALKYLKFPEQTIANMLVERRKFTFQSRPACWLSDILTTNAENLEINDSEKSTTVDVVKNENEGEVNVDIFHQEDKVVRYVPAWWLAEFQAGNLHGTSVKLLLYLMLRGMPEHENITYPPVTRIETKLITFIFELLTSFSNDSDNVLQMHFIADKSSLFTQKLLIQKWPKELREIRDNDSIEERRKIMCDGLDIKESKYLQQLPNSYKLYVIAIVYWMSSMKRCKRLDTSFLALLLTMVFGFIYEQVGYEDIIRNEPNCETAEGELKECCGKTKRNISIARAIMGITKDVAVAASDFFKCHLRQSDDDESHSDDKKTILTFKSFDKCLSLIIQLNVMLNYPYDSPPVDKLFNKTLLYNIYDELVTSESTESPWFLHDKLKSQNLCHFVNLLKTNVLSMVKS